MEQADLLTFAIATLDHLDIPYAIIGSFASGVWGEARFTQDIDILIRLAADRVYDLCEAFPMSDFFVNAEAAARAVHNHGQFNVIHPSSGNKIDFMIAGQNAWTSRELIRRKKVELFPGKLASVASPEDVILGKLLYYREGGSDKHLRDITSILKISDQFIDQAYIAQTAVELGAEQIWQAIASRMAIE